MKQWFKGENSGQTYLILNFEISSYCNADCPSCFRTHRKELITPINHLSVEEFESLILNNINFFKYHTLDSKYEFLTARFCGEIGDPLISPHLEDLIRIAETVFDKIDIFTNGGMRSPNWFKKILSHNKKTHFVFGIDGLTDEMNQIYRVKVKTDLAFKNMIESAKHRYTRWDYTIFNHNFHELKDVIGFSKTNGINLQCRFNGREFHKIDDKHLKECEELLLKNDVRYYICK